MVDSPPCRMPEILFRYFLRADRCPILRGKTTFETRLQIYKPDLSRSMKKEGVGYASCRRGVAEDAARLLTAVDRS